MEMCGSRIDQAGLRQLINISQTLKGRDVNDIALHGAACDKSMYGIPEFMCDLHGRSKFTSYSTRSA